MIIAFLEGRNEGNDDVAYAWDKRIIRASRNALCLRMSLGHGQKKIAGASSLVYRPFEA